MANTYDMSNIAQTKFEKLIGHDASSIAEPKQAVIGEDSMQTHGSGVKYALMAQIAERAMAMDNLNLLSNEDLS